MGSDFRGSTTVASSLLCGASLCVLALWAPKAARANFCSDPADAVGRTEAEELESEPFSQTPSSGEDLIGDRDYNARLITCNRKRDSHGNELDADSLASFGTELPARTVKGHYNYYGFAPGLRYAYDLRRDNGTWVVTVPARIHWPSRRRTMVDIPMELAEDLGLTAAGEICERGATVVDVDNPRKVEEGHIPWELPADMQGVFIQDQQERAEDGDPIFATRGAVTAAFDSRIDSILQSYDISFYGGEHSCRVPRDLVWDGVGILHHYRFWWMDVVADGWNRPGFRVDLRFLDCEEPPPNTPSACDEGITDRERSAWEKDETIWELHLNLQPFHRPSYKRWTFKLNHMHTGSHSSTVVHEVGHQLGLDDEYGESVTSPRHCTNVLPGANAMYLMCDADTAKGGGNSTNVALGGTKGVYPWIITRRYGVARQYQCRTNDDCPDGRYCDTGTLTVGRNECKPFKSEGALCSADKQCEPPAECGGFPPMRCVIPGSKAMGESCRKNVECETDKCEGGECVCNRDWHCTGDAQCKRPVTGQNYCTEERGLGARCDRNAQCESGKCERGECVCNRDSDCPGGRRCRRPVTKKNYCE